MEKTMYSKPLVDKKKEELKKKIQILEQKPKLLVIQVGNNEASSSYIKGKKKACLEVGMDFSHIKLEENVTTNDLIEHVESANNDESINGILVQLPLPNHINKDVVINRIIPTKDVDGLSLLNVGKLNAGLDGLYPCTALGIINLLKFYKVEIKGKKVVVIGRSNLVGKPVASLLLKEDATVTICHSKTENLNKITNSADILICAIGKKNFIKKEHIKKGAVLIDVGITKQNKKLYGDIDFDDVYDKCKLITPVPKGVGPMTVITLLENVLKASKDTI